MPPFAGRSSAWGLGQGTWFVRKSSCREVHHLLLPNRAQSPEIPFQPPPPSPEAITPSLPLDSTLPDDVFCPRPPTIRLEQGVTAWPWTNCARDKLACARQHRHRLRVSTLPTSFNNIPPLDACPAHAQTKPSLSPWLSTSTGRRSWPTRRALAICSQPPSTSRPSRRLSLTTSS